MRIDPSVKQAAPSRTQRTQGSSPESPRPEGAAKPIQDTSAYVPATELQALLEAARQQPQVRREILKDVAERLAQGEYQTRAAAERAADALLGE